MKNRGFTVVELVAIIAIIAAISLVSFPAYTNMTKVQMEKDYETFIDDLCYAAKSYVYDNMDDYEVYFNNEDSELDISLGTLITLNYLDSDMRNPKTKESIDSEDELHVIIKSDNTFSCSID